MIFTKKYLVSYKFTTGITEGFGNCEVEVNLFCKINTEYVKREIEKDIEGSKVVILAISKI